MENKKEMLLKAYKEGKIIQYFNSIEWTDFVPQNQVDSPNFDYKIDNWRVKPEEETLDEAAERYYEKNKYKSDYPHCPSSFKDGAKWQAERMYTKNDMFFFAGYLQGAKECKPGRDVGDIFDEWEKNLKHITHDTMD